MLEVRLWGLEVHHPMTHVEADDYDVDYVEQPMNLAGVLDAYTRSARLDTCTKPNGAPNPNGECHKLHTWNHITGDFKYEETFKVPDKDVVHDGTENVEVETPAVKLYSIEDPRSGGTYTILNGLLSRGKTRTVNENDVIARLLEYNKDPVEGSSLAKKHKFWLHAFRILWHTMAEMNLRTAQIAIAESKNNDGQRTFTDAAAARVTKMVNEKVFHDVVWSAPHRRADYPDELYRGLCVAKGDIKLSYLTR